MLRLTAGSRMGTVKFSSRRASLPLMLMHALLITSVMVTMVLTLPTF